MDYKSFIIKALQNKDAKILNKYKNLTEEMVEHNKLNKKYLLQNNALSIQQIGGEFKIPENASIVTVSQPDTTEQKYCVQFEGVLTEAGKSNVGVGKDIYIVTIRDDIIIKVKVHLINHDDVTTECQTAHKGARQKYINEHHDNDNIRLHVDVRYIFVFTAFVSG